MVTAIALLLVPKCQRYYSHQACPINLAILLCLIAAHCPQYCLVEA